MFYLCHEQIKCAINKINFMNKQKVKQINKSQRKMKKFLTSVFMLSMVLFSISVFNSCKDYDEDEYNDLLVSINKEDSNVKDLITTNYNNLKYMVDTLSTARQACENNCKTKFTELDSKITELIAKDGQLQAAIDSKADAATVNALQTGVDEIKSDISAIQGEIATIQTTDSVLQEQIDTINVTLTDIQAALKKLAGTQGATIDDILDQVSDNKSTLDDLITNVVTPLNTTVTGLQTSLNDLNNKFGNYYTKTEANGLLDGKADAKNVYSKVDIDGMITTINNHFVTLESQVNTVAANANEALQRAKNDSIWIKALEGVVADNKTELEGKITNLASLVNGNTTTIANVKKDLVDYIAENNLCIDSLASVTKALDVAIKTAEANYKAADVLLNDQIVALDGRITSVEAKITVVETAYAAADKTLQDNIDALATKVTANTASINTLSSKIDDLTGRMNDVEEALKSLITGVLVQATDNPVFGSVLLPIGISSNVLMAYYGTNDNPIIFPTTATGNNVKASETLTSGDWSMISSGLTQFKKTGNSTLISDADDNAGTLYVTINPNTVNFAGQQLNLVNSKDAESGVKLSTLKKENDTELKFGYTRATTDNGFYSTKAKVTADQIDNVKINITSGLQSAFKSVLQNRDAASVETLASKLYSQFSGIASAQALKASWNTKSNGKTITHSTYSYYNIAATAIKPLSFSFLQDLDVQTLPGVDKAKNLINRVATGIHSRIPVHLMSNITKDIQNLTIKEIEIKDLTPDQLALFEVSIDTTIVISGKDYTIDFHESVPVNVNVTATTDINTTVTTSVAGSRYSVYDAVGNVVGYVDIPDVDATGSIADKFNTTGTASGTANIDLSKTVHFDGQSVRIWLTRDLSGAAEELWGSVQGQLGDVNTMLSQVKTIVADANDLISAANEKLADVDGYIDTIVNKLYSYIDKINDKLCNLINSVNSRIQPVMFVSNTSTGLKKASTAKGAPTIIGSAAANLIPTTFTAEVVAPAYKKHVAVTNVFAGNSKSAQGGDSNCLAALKYVNAQDNVNTVVDGLTRSIYVTFKPGFVYEIAYSALDYSGKISIHKYYVKY